jgi:hypothetical protein
MSRPCHALPSHALDGPEHSWTRMGPNRPRTASKRLLRASLGIYLAHARFHVSTRTPSPSHAGRHGALNRSPCRRGRPMNGPRHSNESCGARRVLLVVVRHALDLSHCPASTLRLPPLCADALAGAMTSLGLCAVRPAGAGLDAAVGSGANSRLTDVHIVRMHSCGWGFHSPSRNVSSWSPGVNLAGSELRLGGLPTKSGRVAGEGSGPLDA